MTTQLKHASPSPQEHFSPFRAPLIRRFKIAAAFIVGALVGTFWLFAIDAGMNGAPPDWRTLLARLTCPFIPLVGVNDFSNYCVPVLNGLTYGLVCWCALRLVHRLKA